MELFETPIIAWYAHGSSVEGKPYLDAVTMDGEPDAILNTKTGFYSVPNLQDFATREDFIQHLEREREREKE